MFDRLTPPSCREPWRKVGISQHVAALGRGPDLKAASTSDVRWHFRQWRDPCRQTRLEAVETLCRPGLETQELSRVPSRGNGRWTFRKACPSTIYQHVE